MYILFDMGATKTRIAYSADGETFEKPEVFKTQSDYERGFQDFAETAKRLASGREIKKIAGGMSRSIEGWNEAKFKEDLFKTFGADVSVENDAAVVALGEASWGAGKGFEIVAYITVSTGVGGARIVGGKIDERSVGFEPGKQIMNVETGENLEELISGKALARRSDQDPREITDPQVWHDLARKLAVGLNNIIVEWSPDCVVLGGSMITGNPAIPLPEAQQHLREILKIFPILPEVKMAELGDFGGLYGSLALIKNLKLN